MPTPNKGEKQDDFISRCIASPEMQAEFPDDAQRTAVCHSIWDKRETNSMQVLTTKDAMTQLSEDYEVIRNALVAASPMTETDEEEEDLVKFIMSTDEVNRSGHILRTEGIDISNFMKNPIVLFNHDDDKPIGNVRRIEIETMANGHTAMVGFIEFFSKDEDEFGFKIGQLVKNNKLKGGSVSFKPLQVNRHDKKTRISMGLDPDRGLDIKTSELLEFSVVSLPRNANTLSVVNSLSLDPDMVLEAAVEAAVEEVVEEVEVKELNLTPEVEGFENLKIEMTDPPVEIEDPLEAIDSIINSYKYTEREMMSNAFTDHANEMKNSLNEFKLEVKELIRGIHEEMAELVKLKKEDESLRITNQLDDLLRISAEQLEDLTKD